MEYFSKPDVLIPLFLTGETDCVNGKTGWDVLINFCGAVQGPSPSGYPITQCGGAAVCLAWAAQGSASAGSAATVAYTSNTTVGMGFTTMKVSGGSPVTGNPRQSTIELYCVVRVATCGGAAKVFLFTFLLQFLMAILLYYFCSRRVPVNRCQRLRPNSAFL